jgi:enterochelin esterase-like enzyme
MRTSAAFFPSGVAIHVRPGTTNSSRSLLARSACLLGLVLAIGLFASPAFAQVGSVTKLNIKSTVLGEDRAILVRTPAGYETNKQAYPVLYMTDGDAHIAHTTSTVDFLARNGRMSELIVVGIPNTDRTRDLSPTKPTQVGATGAP